MNGSGLYPYACAHVDFATLEPSWCVCRSPYEIGKKTCFRAFSESSLPDRLSFLDLFNTKYNFIFMFSEDHVPPAAGKKL